MRAYLSFVAAIVLAGLLGAALAYPAYSLATGFAPFAFHRVASRLAMLLLAGELVWLCRRLRIVRRADWGYGLPRRRFLGVAARWGAVGVGTAALGAAFLLADGLRIRDPQFLPSAAGIFRVLTIGLTSGVAVALIEETVMRGAIHTAVERESGPVAAVLLIAPLFAILHFFARARISPAEVGWDSGFTLLARSFTPLAHPALVLDAFLSWVAVGLLLGLVRVLTGNVAAAIGLHAGWVAVLRALQETTVPGPGAGNSAWVSRLDGLLGLWLLPWAVAIGAALWLTRARWVPYARSDSASRR